MTNMCKQLTIEFPPYPEVNSTPVKPAKPVKEDKKEVVTPMMKTWQEIKKNYPDALLLFRCGDFYEIMCEDAPIAAKVLDITLTYRTTRNGDKRYEMCGFPIHALDVYLPKLVRAGHRVAICDAIEKPKEKKQTVKRKVTELVTPVKN